jgi:hypothetical protein
VSVQRDASVNDFTGWIAPLERVVLKKDQFLHDAPPPSATGPSAPVSSPAEPMQQPLSAPSAKPPAAAREHRPATPTLFGEKLQAVLGDRN